MNFLTFCFCRYLKKNHIKGVWGMETFSITSPSIIKQHVVSFLFVVLNRADGFSFICRGFFRRQQRNHIKEKIIINITWGNELLCLVLLWITQRTSCQLVVLFYSSLPEFLSLHQNQRCHSNGTLTRIIRTWRSSLWTLLSECF